MTLVNAITKIKVMRIIKQKYIIKNKLENIEGNNKKAITPNNKRKDEIKKVFF